MQSVTRGSTATAATATATALGVHLRANRADAYRAEAGPENRPADAQRSADPENPQRRAQLHAWHGMHGTGHARPFKCCDNSLYGFKGAPSARRAPLNLVPPPHNRLGVLLKLVPSSAHRAPVTSKLRYRPTILGGDPSAPSEPVSFSTCGGWATSRESKGEPGRRRSPAHFGCAW